MIKINKRGESYLEENLIYIVLFVLFLAMGFAYLNKYQNNAYFQEQYYSYSVAKAINMAQPGDRIELNMDRAIETARKEGIAKFDNIFVFDNLKKEVGVSLQKGKVTIYPFLRDYTINEVSVEDSINGFVLNFKVEGGENA